MWINHHGNDATLTEYALVVDLLDDEPQSGGKDADEDMQIKEEGHPCCGLVLRHGRDDRDVNLGVARVPQRVEASAPGGDVAWGAGRAGGNQGLPVR